MADAMKGVTKALRSMNKGKWCLVGVNLPEISKIMMDFERESDMMDMKQDMISDTIDDAMEADDEEEESEAIINQVLDEIGINLYK